MIQLSKEIDDDFKTMINKCCEIKLKIIENDFEEKEGQRRILNFGHTVGHAIEKMFNFELGHGQAVAMGMIAESYMSLEMNLFSQKDFHQVVEILKPFISSKKIDLEKAIDLMALDKKSMGSSPRFVMIRKIGEVDECSGQYCMPLEKEIILSGLQFISKL